MAALHPANELDRPLDPGGKFRLREPDPLPMMADQVSDLAPQIAHAIPICIGGAYRGRIATHLTDAEKLRLQLIARIAFKVSIGGGTVMFKAITGLGKAQDGLLPEGCQAWDHEHIGGQGMNWITFDVRLKTIGNEGWELVASFVDMKGNPHAMFKRPRVKP